MLLITGIVQHIVHGNVHDVLTQVVKELAEQNEVKHLLFIICMVSVYQETCCIVPSKYIYFTLFK